MQPKKPEPERKRKERMKRRQVSHRWRVRDDRSKAMSETPCLYASRQDIVAKRKGDDSMGPIA
jgi:hypothetical protein